MKLPLPKRAKSASAEATLTASESPVNQIKSGKVTKAFKLRGRSKFILSLGDEGAILVHYKSAGVEGRWFAAEPSPENLDVFSKALAMDSSAPILVLLDTIDQTYSQQTLPPVSKMNLNGLLKRRIRREFGDTPLKGHYLLGRNDNKEWNFMLYAIEQSEVILKWIDWVLQHGTRPLGIRIMPLEMTSLADIMYQLYQSQHSILSEDACQWKFIVCHNKISGFRQVIVKDNAMIFTRLGQPLEGGTDVQAGMIEQEISSTLEYLKRIGLRSLEDLHLHIIAAQDIINIIDVTKLGVSSKSMGSPYQISQMLQWQNVAQPEDKYADVLLAIFALANKKSIAKLWTLPLDKIKKLYLVKPILRSASAAIAIGSLGFTGLSAYNWWNHSEKIDDSQKQISQINKEIEELKATVNMPPEELEKILDLYDLYTTIQKQKLNPKNFMELLSKGFETLPEDMLVQELVWEETAAATGATGAEGAAAAPTVAPTSETAQTQVAPAADGKLSAIPSGTPIKVKGTLNINTLVPANIKNEALKLRSQGIVDKIQSNIPNYIFTVSELPGTKNTNDSISIDLNAPSESSDTMSLITLKTSFTGTEYIPDLQLEAKE